MLIFPPPYEMWGGPKTFALSLINYLESLEFQEKDCVLVINGPKRSLVKIFYLKFIKRKFIILRLGSPIRSNIIQDSSFLAALKFAPSYYTMKLLACIAHDVIVQSNYTKNQWSKRVSEKVLAKFRVVYNPISYCGINPPELPNHALSIVCVEGTLPEPSDCLALAVYDLMRRINNEKNIKLNLIGNFNEKTWSTDDPNITLHGFVAREEIIKILNRSNLYVCSDNYTSACPNSVIDALAAGLEVYAPSGSPGDELFEIVTKGLPLKLRNDPVQYSKEVARRTCEIFAPEKIFSQYFEKYDQSVKNA